MKQGEQNGTEKSRKERLAALWKDRTARAFLFSVLSLSATLLFAGYNVFLWLAYGAAWNIGIAVYYALLAAARADVLFAEEKARRLCDEERERMRNKRFLAHAIFLFAIDLALIAPISFMVMQKQTVRYSQIPAIATAAYTTYKIAVATKNFLKNKKEKNLSLKILKTLNFVDALVSVLSLQYVLVMTFGEGVTDKMLILCATTSFAVWVLLLVVSAFSLWRAVAERRKRLS